jgi:hypothetical protein
LAASVLSINKRMAVKASFRNEGCVEIALAS